MTKKAVKARLRALRKKFGLGEFRKAAKRRLPKKRSVSSMAHRRSRRSGGMRSGGIGKFRIPPIGKMAEIAGVAGVAAYASPSVMPTVNPKVVAAAAGFATGGVAGAVIGFLAGVPVANMISSQVGNMGSQSGSSGAFVNS